jgi:putative oxidoreductase
VRFLDRLQPLALLVLRVVLGAIMLTAGYHKVFGGLPQHMQTVQRIGFPAWMGYLSTGTEFFGGMLVIVGLLTRLVGFAMAFEMTVVVLKVHLKNGLLGNGGFGFPLALASMGFLLIFFGGGPIALDAVFRGGGGGKFKRAK